MAKIYYAEGMKLIEQHRAYKKKAKSSKAKLTAEQKDAVGWANSLLEKLSQGLHDAKSTVEITPRNIKEFDQHKDNLPLPLLGILNQYFSGKKHIQRTKAFREMPATKQAEVEFQEIVKRGKKQIASEGKHDRMHSLDSGIIFFETQSKRLLRGLFNLLRIKDNPFKYFSRDENKNPEQIYKLDALLDKVEKGTSLHNINHATVLIQTCGLNILTDPVFGALNPAFYPSKTDPGVLPENFKNLDAILISHNHRDHLDEPSLKLLAAQNPNVKIHVPKGDKDLIEKMGKIGFRNVIEFEWYETLTLEKNGKKVQLAAVPADHWSGRGIKKGEGVQHSSVNGWVINPKNQKGIFYFAGDSAKLSEARVKTISQLIYMMFKNKKIADGEKLTPEFYNLQPGGPNYTRREMVATHQSMLESLLSTFRIAQSIAEMDKEFETDPAKRKTAAQWLDASTAVIMHHNKYELGPDRFNENMFIMNKVIKALVDTKGMAGGDQIQELRRLAKREKDKKLVFSIFGHNKKFVYDGIESLLMEARKMWPDVTNNNALNEKLIQYLSMRTHFPLIGERRDTQDFFPDRPKP
jgi:L-ascorbate metabolism protein UlaG (beta-lactamase superfamily)